MEEALNGVKRTLYCGELREQHIGQRVTIMGWVQKQRNKGSLIFLDIRDRKGVVQAVLSQDQAAEETFEKASRIRSEYVVAVTGIVKARDGGVNEKLATGGVEVEVQEIKILSQAKTPPFQILDEVEARDELRFKIPLSGSAQAAATKKSPAAPSGGPVHTKLFESGEFSGD